MANIDNELIKGEIINAVENAIRYKHLEGGASSSYEIERLKRLHLTLVRKAYKSEEMRREKYLPQSVAEGTDLGTHFTRKVVRGEA